jgi:predicted MFS family arabinose efflux permease
MGLGESLFITALSAWNIARVGPAYAGRVMAWSGIAMYGALALGAPIGLEIDHLGGFFCVAIATMLFPAAGAIMAACMTRAVVMPVQRASALRVMGAIWMPGLAMALASCGIGTIVAFLTLRYQMEGWSNAGFALTGFGAGYIIVRLIFGGLPDRLGGYRTASFSLCGEAIGLLVLWLAPSALVAFAAASFIGLSYSLVFPSLGVEAIRRAPGENRGLVLGTYFACFDLGLATAGPIAGVVIQFFGLPAAFLFASLAAAVALVLTRLAHRQPPLAQQSS